MNEMRVNDSEMSLRWNHEAWLIPEISLSNTSHRIDVELHYVELHDVEFVFTL